MTVENARFDTGSIQTSPADDDAAGAGVVEDRPSRGGEIGGGIKNSHPSPALLETSPRHHHPPTPSQGPGQIQARRQITVPGRCRTQGVVAHGAAKSDSEVHHAGRKKKQKGVMVPQHRQCTSFPLQPQYQPPSVHVVDYPKRSEIHQHICKNKNN